MTISISGRCPYFCRSQKRLEKNSLKLSHSVCFFFCRLTDRTDFNLDICVGGLHVCNKMFSLQSMITITNSNLQYEYDVCELTGSGRNILTTMSYNRFTLTSRKFHSFFPYFLSNGRQTHMHHCSGLKLSCILKKTATAITVVWVTGVA